MHGFLIARICTINYIYVSEGKNVLDFQLPTYTIVHKKNVMAKKHTKNPS
jgi:hypothetical protein